MQAQVPQLAVAKALVNYVWQAEPVNYTHKAYYFDGPTVLEFGIKNGSPYYNETELRLSEKEFTFGQCQDVRRIGSAALELAYTA